MALERELLARGHRVGREVSVNIYYKGTILTSQRLDFIVDEKLTVESKATEILPAKAKRQLSERPTSRLASYSISAPSQSSTASSRREL
jgi:GxxExxY protein